MPLATLTEMLVDVALPNPNAPPPPTLTWYVCTAGSAASARSTAVAAFSLASTLVPGGIFCVMFSVVPPELSRKFVFSREANPTVPPKISNASRTTTSRLRVANRITGRYARCSTLRRSFSTAACRARSASSAFAVAGGGFRNQYARTGTTVSATSSDASSATVTVMANGENSSPTSPPTNAIGRNTATVVSVDDVTAPATSRTPSSTARSRASP